MVFLKSTFLIHHFLIFFFFFSFNGRALSILRTVLVGPYFSEWINITQKEGRHGTSLAVQWLRLHASAAGDRGLIPDQGTKIPHAVWHGQKIFFNVFKTSAEPRLWFWTLLYKVPGADL